MLFPEDDAPLLKAWIVQRLANTSDADADVLADYVLALLRHDGNVETIRRLFEEEIPDFLRDDSGPFTDDVFQAVTYRSYLPGAPPPPAIVRQAPAPAPASQIPQIPQGPTLQQQAPYQPSHPHMFPEIYHTPYAETPAFSNRSFRNGGRKRSYRDLDAPDPQAAAWNPYNPSPYQHYDLNDPPPYKQARRGGGFLPRGGRQEEPRGMRGRGGPAGFSVSQYPGPGFSSGPPGYSPHEPYQASPSQAAPQIDASTILENIRQLQELGQQMGIQMPQTGSLPRPVSSGPAVMSSQPARNRQTCRDFETKGFCSRGNRCQFDHGTGSVYPPSFIAPPAEEYDPNDASIRPPLLHPGQPPRASEKFRPFERDFQKPRRKGGSRATFSHDGPMNDKTKTKVVVEHIPEENFTEDAIRDFFAQFGTIEEISLLPSHPKRIAIVKFDNWASANVAMKSPKVIFDNRFVKVYWYKDELPAIPETKHANGAKHGSANGHANGDEAPEEPEFDIEEFKRKQEEAQKLHEEKMQKREEFERQRQELEAKRRALIARQQEEKRKLQTKLAVTGAREGSISPVLSRPGTDSAKNAQAEALRAKLAELEAEADSLGLDPEAAQEEASWAPRGRGRGRRPFFRGRGSYPPRAYRGGYGYRSRGGGGVDVHAAYAAYSLDNRPKIISLTGADFTEPTKDEALREYLLGIGDFAEIHTDPTTTHVTFKDRKTAEQFMFGVSANKMIPGVEEKLELAWVNSAPKSAGTDSDSVEDMGDVKNQDDNMDYGGEWEVS